MTVGHTRLSSSIPAMTINHSGQCDGCFCCPRSHLDHLFLPGCHQNQQVFKKTKRPRIWKLQGMFNTHIISLKIFFSFWKISYSIVKHTNSSPASIIISWQSIFSHPFPPLTYFCPSILLRSETHKLYHHPQKYFSMTLSKNPKNLFKFPLVSYKYLKEQFA